MRFLTLTVLIMLACFQASATDLSINAGFFLANPSTNRQIVLTPQNPFPGNNIFLPPTDTNGITYLSNAPTGLINGQIKAPPGLINFQLYITGPNLGLIDASNCLATGQASTYPAGQTAWAIATSDLRYALNGSTASNTFYPLFSNPSNYVQLPILVAATNGFASTNYVNDSTNTISNNLSNQVVNATNGNYQVLSQQIINATNPIPAQIASAIQIATNNPDLTFLGINPVTSVTVFGSGSSAVSTPSATGTSVVITIAPQTNGIGSIAFSNSTDYLTTNQFASYTNGLITTNDLANYATIPFVNSSVAPLATTGQLNQAYLDLTNQSLLIGANGTNNDILFEQSATLFSLFVGSNSTNYANILFNLSIANDTTTSNGVIAYVNASTNSIFQASTNIAGQIVNSVNQQTLYTITNASANASFYSFINTNTIIAATGFGTPSVNTLFFTKANNTFASATGIYYTFDGANWDFWSPSTGILYSLGGLSPVGNTYTVGNGANPAGFTYYTNAPTSQFTFAAMTNIAQNIQMFGFVTGVPTNNSLSFPSGSNQVYQIATAAAVAAGGPTNGVTAPTVTNIASVMISSANLVTNAATRSVTLNLAGSTNLPVLQSLSGTGFTVTYSQLPNGFSNANLTVSGGGGGSTLAYFNNNTPAGLLTTNSTSVGVGTNALYSVMEGIADPNGTVSGIKGQYYSRFDSSGNFLFLQINTNGATGWQ